jgi:desulfoferrodoxin (superoxide reductase-like protein)
MIVFNEEPRDVIDEKHVCFYTKTNGAKLQLYQVILRKLKHPNTDNAFVQKYDSQFVEEFDRTDYHASPAVELIVVLEAAQNILQTKMRRKYE